MRLITYNIQFCRGRDGVFNVPRVVRELAGADIVALQEVERNWDRSVDVDQPVALSDLMPDYFWAYGATFDICKGWKAARAAQPTANRRRQFGNMILSRYPILSVRRHLLPRLRDPDGGFTMQRGVLEATVATPEGLLRIMATHLDKMGETGRLAQADAILDIHREACDAPGPAEGAEEGDRWNRLWREAMELPPSPSSAILMGDLNTVPDSPVMARLLDPALGDSRFVDAWSTLGKPADGGATCYRDFSTKQGERLDYCLMTPDLADRLTDARIAEEAEGSEHQPLIVELS